VTTVWKTSKGSKARSLLEISLVILDWGIRLAGTFFDANVKGSKGGIDMIKNVP
jgi:hypothetical protein